MASSRSVPEVPVLPATVSDAASLRAFVAVARLGTVGRAAEALGRTQPSVSARLAVLETAWGTKLFRRQARGMGLTPEGARLLPAAEGALRALEELDRLAGLPVAARGELRVGAGDALGREVLPSVLSRLVREEPKLAVRVVEAGGARLLEALLAGEIDVALVVQGTTDLAREGLAVGDLFESPVDVLLPPRGTPPSTKRAIPLESLRDERLVALQTGSSFRRHLESAFAARGVPFAPAVEVGSLSLVRRFVAAGLGVAPVPALAFSRRSAGPRVERRRLHGVPPVRYARAIRAGVPMPRAVGRLVALLQSVRTEEP